MTSLWLDRTSTIPTDAPDGPGSERRFDEIVVGAGITGLVTALLLARAGHRVAVLEARGVGAVATGNTTAKLSVLQGAHLQRIKRRTYQAVVQAYVDANLAGQRWMLDFAGQHDVPVERVDAVSYSTTHAGVETIRRELAVARLSGLPVASANDVDLPFRTTAAVVLPDQAQFDPMVVLAALAAEFRGLGGRIIEGVRVTWARATKPVEVSTTAGGFECDHLVLATGTPVLDRGLYFAKLSAHRSYAASFTVTDQLPPHQYLSVDAPSRSIRTAQTADGVQLLVGGNGHGVGREPSPAARVEELTTWTKRYWAGAERTHVWSAQDYETPHGVPFVGLLPRGRGRISIATGYDKWGMTNGVQCAITLAAQILDTGLPDWATTLHHRFTLPMAIARGVGMNAAVAKHYATGYTRALGRPLKPTPPREGWGTVGRVGFRPTAVSTVDGVTCRVSGVCPHLGAVVSWNDQERSWDCPAHGSRFTADGRLLEGPATSGLPRRA
ncbi:FAD-dependent oxidoreductase [Plantibacter sp. YIM 135347]|uniref:FAD-dependent oxidoreductase n=1 Tax=Plantibacter sp. YIM 135347 TaxID=3423919 RepID=UPI003D32FA0D